MIKGFAHICLDAVDLDASRKFYLETLGLENAFDFENNGKPFGFYAKLNNRTFIEVFETKSVEETALGKGVKHFCLEVEDINAIEERLNSCGVETWNKSIGCDQSWQIWCKDPSGNSIEFHQYTDKSSQFTGETCRVNWKTS